MRKILVLANQSQKTCENIVKQKFPDLKYDEVIVFQSLHLLTEEVKRDGHLYIHCIVETGRNIDDLTTEVLTKNNAQIVITKHVQFKPD